MPFSFSHRKATQTLNYFARQEGGSINKLKALKLVYFADRYHLRRYSRPIIGDEYLAMNYGPVPTGTKDLAEMTDFLGEGELSYGTAYLRPLDRYSYSSQAPVESEVFSVSDREALAWSWKHFGNYDGFALAEMTHAYPEWLKHEPALKSKLASRVPMNYRDFLSDPAEGVELCHPLNDEERAAVVSGIEDLASFERAWN